MSSQKSLFHNILNKTGRGTMCTSLEEHKNIARLFNHYQNLALNRYRWENLPDGIESRHIEQALFYNGTAVFFKQKYTSKYRCLPAYGLENPNLYGDWDKFNAYGYNGIVEELTIDKCVPIYENDTKYPIINHVYHYSELIAEIDRTIHINTKQQRRPYMINTTKDLELTAKKLMEKIESDEYVIQDKGLSGKRKDDLTIEVLQTKSEFLIDRLNEAKHELESDLLDILGLNNNSNQDKRERLLVDEVNVNNGYILSNLDLGFKNRQYACELINKKFGLNIRVVKVKDLLDQTFKGEEKGEGEENVTS